MNKRILVVVFLAVMLIAAAAFAADGSTSRSKCINNATKKFLSCTSDCNATRKDDVLLCRYDNNTGVRDCVKSCLKEKKQCIKSVRTSYDACLADSKEALTAALAECNDLGILLRVACKSAARLEKLSADLQCLSEFKRDDQAQADLKDCSTQSSACILECKKGS